MPRSVISQIWRDDVCRILRNNAPGTIQRTEDFLYRFQGSFPNAWEYEVRDSIHAYLRRPDPEGRQVYMKHPPGETWEFLFLFQNKLTYGKLLLRTDRQRIKLISAHLADRPELRND